jgi:hypothetical protein
MTDTQGQAAGDITKSGKVQPYSYIPMDPKLLNKRYVPSDDGCWLVLTLAHWHDVLLDGSLSLCSKQARAKSQFKATLAAAKKGAKGKR